MLREVKISTRRAKWENIANFPENNKILELQTKACLWWDKSLPSCGKINKLVH